MKGLSLTILFLFFALTLSAEKVNSNQAVKDIDRLINAELKKQNSKANPPISDEIFLRRIYLDLCGRIPTPEEADLFHAQKSQDKRSLLIDSLLMSEGYNSDQLNYWSDILRIYRERGHTLDSAAYHLWLRKSINDNKPYDKLVSQLVSARGKVWDNGAVGYYVRDRGMPLDNMSNTVRIFLGVRLECAQCHDHPFDDWTQKDYYKMAAFSYGVITPNIGYEKNSNRYKANRSFSQKEREAYHAVAGKKMPFINSQKNLQANVKRYDQKRRQKYLKRMNLTEQQFKEKVTLGIEAIEKTKKQTYAEKQAMNQLYGRTNNSQAQEDTKRALKLPHDYQYDNAKPHDVIQPETMFGTKIDLAKTDKNKLEAYAAWMTSKENPNFAKTVANRLWAKIFGVGVINPVDDMAGYTKNSNPELLNYLEKLIKDLDFDLKVYQGILTKTKAYQREANRQEYDAGKPYYFPGPLLKRMSAEQIWDSLVSLTIKNADDFHPGIAKQQKLIKDAYTAYSNLEGKPYVEFKKMIQNIGENSIKGFKEQERLAKLVQKATDEKNKSDYNKYRKELGRARNTLRENMYTTAFGQDPQLSNAPAMMMSMATMTNSSTANMLTKIPKPEKMTPPAGLDKNKKRAWLRQEKNDYRTYMRLITQVARASELDQPSRRGHFLRDFGQSDREMIENSSKNASIPQALNLLNGQIIDALANRYSLLGKRLFLAKTPETKITAIFQAMLTRKPTADEMTMILEDIKEYGQRSYRGLIWSLLNTQQFIFVQ